MVLLCGVFALTACDDDHDSNPTLQEPTTFKLNTPAYAAEEIDLGHSSYVYFTWSQPDYGFPAAAQYQVQLSLTDTYTVSFDEEEADKTGTKVADYATLDQIYTSCEADADAEAMAKGLQQVGKWQKNEVLDAKKVYVRIMSVYAGDTIYSNSVTINVIPYYVELKDADPEMWYILGSCIGDGGWSASATSIGTSVVPMFPKEGVEYDKKTGKGIIEYAGWFPADASFKILNSRFSWEYAFCSGGEAGKVALRDGGDDPGNITVPKAGYYLVEVNTTTVTCEITEITEKPTVYSSMSLTGAFSGALDKMDTVEGTENHVWKLDVTVDADGTVKFTDGTTEWGGDAFPYGVAVKGGNGIPATAGNYQVFFNDITGGYYFFSK